MASSATILNNTYWEGTNTWPSVNKVLNVYGFNLPDKRFSVAAQAPNMRAQGYPNTPVNFQSRGAPQLTWFEGSYDQYAHQGKYPEKCAYPNLVGPWKSDGTRDCLDPGKLTAAEIAALAAEQAKMEAAMSAGIKEQTAAQSKPKWSCTATFRGADGKNYVGSRLKVGTKEYIVYTKVAKNGDTQYYDCSTDKIVFTMKPTAIRGLGATEVETETLSEQNKTYRTIELSMLAAVTVGLFLIWRK